MNTMPMIHAHDAVIVSKESVDSPDPYDILRSNLSFVNALFEEHVEADEVSPDALLSYYVDYYLGQMLNGGFSQFVYNSKWNERIIRLVRQGLRAVRAPQHVELFEQSARILDRIGPERLEVFFESEYFGENQERDILNAYDDRFSEILKREDLTELNAAWLRSLPNLVVLNIDEMNLEVQRRADAIPNLEERIATALANEPRYMKIIRALCNAAGHKLSCVTAGDPTHEYNGRRTLAWHFLTDLGHHYMVDAGDKALMLHGTSGKHIIEIDTKNKYGAPH